MREAKIVAAALYLLLALPALSFLGWSLSADALNDASDASVAIGLAGFALTLVHAYAALRLGMLIIVRNVKARP